MSSSHFQGFGGIQLAAHTFGDPGDPAVLLLHGGGQSKGSWRGAGEALAAAGRFAILLDLRGHGSSAWAADGRYDLDAFIGDLHAVLGSLPRRPVIVAASLGGLVALAALGEAAADLAAGLVLVDTSPTPELSEARRVSTLMRSQGGGFASIEDAVEAAAAIAPDRPPLTEQALNEHLRRGDDGRWHWQWDPLFLERFDSADAATRITAALARLRLPTLIVRGARSALVPEQVARELRAAIAGAELVEIEGAGHLVTAQRAEAFNAVLLEFLERRVPRAPLSYEAGSEPRVLRDALGCFGTGVTVITTVDQAGHPVGLTANSFTSVSLDPPLILFCLARSSANLPVFEEAGKFGVNVLHIGQQPTSDRFAARRDDRFVDGDWESWDTGVPLLRGSLASFECDTFAMHDGGDHLILIGRVRRAAFEPSRDPLLYFRGKYRRLHFA